MIKEDFGYILPLTVMAILLILGLIYFLFKFRKIIKLKDEKIQSLRYTSAQNEKRQESKAQEANKKIIELTHSINRLETNASEGTKNQVVTKIEAQQNRRARELKRTGLEEA